MKPISTDNHYFDDLITRGALYVDKTQFVWNLVSGMPKIYFLSRPRRFGKSLLISTLKAYSEGKHNLFKGLAIERLVGDNWEKCPVIHLDMAQVSTRDDYESAKIALTNCIKDVVRWQGLTSSRMEEIFLTIGTTQVLPRS